MALWAMARDGLPYPVTWQRRSLTEELCSAVHAGILHGVHGSHALR